LTSNDTHSITFRTARSKPARSFNTTNVSSTSINVREKLPETSLYAKFSLETSFRRQRKDLELTYGCSQSGPRPVQDNGDSYNIMNEKQSQAKQTSFTSSIGKAVIGTHITAWTYEKYELKLTVCHVVVKTMIPKSTSSLAECQ
jgi:hypothetical protein